MKRYTLTCIIALTAASTVFAASAGPTSTHGLREADAKLTARAGVTSNGAAQTRLLQERARVRQLIDDIESGKSVDPSAIDRAINNADHQ